MFPRRVAVHPHVIRNALAGEAMVREYQVRQAGNGIEVACVTGGDLDAAALPARLEHAMRQAGLPRPRSGVACGRGDHPRP